MLEETLEILQRELGKSLYETLIMMGISLAVSLIFGLTLGFLLYLTADRNFFKTRVLHKLVAFVINFIRSVPFIILVVFSLPLTFYLVGTKIGPIAAAVPMSISATVFLSRLIEMALKEIDKGVIEAAFSTGASSFLIIKNVLMVEAAPSIARGVTVTFIIIIGSEGTLGVITRITLKLLPLPDYTQSAVIAYHALADAIASVNVILKGNLEPTAIEFVEKRCIALGERYLNSEFPCRDADSYLIVTFDGTKEMVTERLNDSKNLVLAHGAYEFIALDDEEVAKNVWAIRSALALAVKAAGVWEPVDTVVPIGSIAKFVEKCREISSAHGVRIVPFGHAGDGNVHLCIIKDAIPDAKWPKILDSTLDALYNCAYELGGLISAEHGIGKAKRRYFLKHINKEARELMLGIKQAFDPLNLFNQHDGYTR